MAEGGGRRFRSVCNCAECRLAAPPRGQSFSRRRGRVRHNLRSAAHPRGTPRGQSLSCVPRSRVPPSGSELQLHRDRTPFGSELQLRVDRARPRVRASAASGPRPARRGEQSFSCVDGAVKLSCTPWGQLEAHPRGQSFSCAGTAFRTPAGACRGVRASARSGRVGHTLGVRASVPPSGSELQPTAGRSAAHLRVSRTPSRHASGSELQLRAALGVRASAAAHGGGTHSGCAAEALTLTVCLTVCATRPRRD